MNILAPLGAVVGFALLAFLTAMIPGFNVFWGVVVPYLAIVLFLGGLVWRVLKWTSVPVPFNITTTCGQQKSLPWIKANHLENPSCIGGVLGRMALEVFCFRSLFRNVKSEFVSRENFEPRLAYKTSLWLWLGALAMHYSFLVIFLRHYRFFSDPVPACIGLLELLDGFFQVGSPTLYITSFLFLGALGFLFLRRVANPQTRYFSLATDYFPLFLLMAVAATGMLMRYTPARVDIVAVKDLCVGLMSFNPVVPAEPIGALFYSHVALVCLLFAYFPFSKLMHMAGVFLSPTRNLRGASRMVRHINPWNHPVHIHTYDEYEDEFRDRMKQAGIPTEKE